MKDSGLEIYSLREPFNRLNGNYLTKKLLLF